MRLFFYCSWRPVLNAFLQPPPAWFVSHCSSWSFLFDPHISNNLPRMLWFRFHDTLHWRKQPGHRKPNKMNHGTDREISKSTGRPKVESHSIFIRPWLRNHIFIQIPQLAAAKFRLASRQVGSCFSTFAFDFLAGTRRRLESSEALRFFMLLTRSGWAFHLDWTTTNANKMINHFWRGIVMFSYMRTGKLCPGFFLSKRECKHKGVQVCIQVVRSPLGTTNFLQLSKFGFVLGTAPFLYLS